MKKMTDNTVKLIRDFKSSRVGEEELTDAVNQLGKSKITEDLPALIDILKHDNENIRKSASEAILNYGDDCLTAIYDASLKDAENSVFLGEILMLLAKIGSAKALYLIDHIKKSSKYKHE